MSSVRCESCGAPASLVRGRDYFQCDFCDSLVFPSESADGVRNLREPAGCECPVCRRELVRASLDKEHALLCERCEGMLIALRTFNVVLRRRRAGKAPGEARRPIDSEHLKRKISCPECGESMSTHPYHGPGNTVIDTCGACLLLWLDRGELTELTRA